MYNDMQQSHVIWLHPQWTCNNTCQQEVYAGNLQDEVNSAPQSHLMNSRDG